MFKFVSLEKLWLILLLGFFLSFIPCLISKCTPLSLKFNKRTAIGYFTSFYMLVFLFFFWLACILNIAIFDFRAPEGAPLKSKMIYASSKDAIKKKFTGEYCYIH